MPARVDAIVMLDGPGDRLHTAEALAWQHRAGTLVVSRGSPVYGHGTSCAARIPGVRVICFNPQPSTTQGEAQFAGRLARQYHWRSIVLVTITPQDTRARIRMERCFSGQVYVMTAPIAAARLAVRDRLRVERHDQGADHQPQLLTGRTGPDKRSLNRRSPALRPAPRVRISTCTWPKGTCR